MCSINCDESLINVFEFEDTDFFQELEAALVILSPKEIVLPSTTGDYEKIKEILDRNNILTTQLKKNDFVKNTEFLQDLEKIYRFRKAQQQNIHALPEIKLDLAMGALAAGLKYLEIVSDETNLKKFTIKELNLNRFLHMDTAAFSALNLFPPAGSSFRSSSYKKQSVLGVLDRCKSNQGRRMLRQWIKQPMKDLDMINQRLDVIQCLVDNEETRNILHKEFMNIMPDVLMLINKLTRKRGMLIDVFKIYQVVSRVPEILKLLSDVENTAVNSMLCTPIKDIIQDLKKIEDLVEEIIDIESLKKGEYLVRASFDEQLHEIKSKMDLIEAKLTKETRAHAKLLSISEGSLFKLDYVTNLGFYLRTNKKEDQAIRKHKQFQIIDTARGGLRVTTEIFKELNAEYAVLKESYEEHQKSIVSEICRIVSGYVIILTNLNHIIATLDVFVSLSLVVSDSPGVYVRPKIYPDNERILQVEALRHPCLECQDDIQYIPNDVNFKEHESELLIITGANISGKSTYVRSIGIAVLLAHMGLLFKIRIFLFKKFLIHLN